MSNKDYTKYAKINGQAIEEIVETEVEPVVEPEVVTCGFVVVEPAESIFEPATTVAIEAEPEVEPEPEVPQRKTGRVFGCAKLNVRKAPNANADVVCELFCHTEVEIDEEESTHDFFKVYTASGIEGFCMKTYILNK